MQAEFLWGGRVGRVRQRIFVYGSLKRGFALHFLLEDQVFLGPARTATPCRLFDLGSYPGLLEDVQGYPVTGELYEVTASCLAALDEAEGTAEGAYERRGIKLEAPHDLQPAEAYFYLRSLSGCREIGATWPAGPAFQ